MRVIYDPDKGKHNLDNLFKEVNNVQINTIRVEESQQSNQRFGIADIEEITDAYGIGNLDLEANVNPMIVNRVPIGKACSPYEIIRVKTESGLFPIVIIYDT